jgi:hypothetical protein
MRALVLFAVLSFAGTAHAGFFSLVPKGVTTIAVGNTVTFEAWYNQEGGDEDVSGAGFHIVVDNLAAAGLTAASTIGNQFQIPGLSTEPFPGPPSFDGLPLEVIMGGSNTFGPGIPGNVKLGEITLTGSSPGTTDLLDGQFSAAIDEFVEAIPMNTPAILATVAVVEPAPIPMWSLLVLAGLLVTVTMRARIQRRILAGWSVPWP